MKHPFLHSLRQFVHHPLTQLCVACVLVGGAISEVIRDLASTGGALKFGLHHGVLAYGLMQILQCLPPLVEGFERWIRATPTDHPHTSPGGE